jgi:hypothetical protein
MPSASLPEKSERAPCGASVVRSGDAPQRVCPICGMPFTGRQQKRSCFPRCRAALSRREQGEAQMERGKEGRGCSKSP